METAYNQQLGIIEEIRRLETNYKKDGPNRWNKNYLTSKLEEINRKIEAFKTIDNEMDQYKGENPKHPYYHERQGMIETYRRFRDIITVALKTTAQTETCETDKQARKIFTFNSKMAMLKTHLTEIRNNIAEPKSKAYLTIKMKFINNYWATIATLHDEIICDSMQDNFDSSDFYELEEIYQMTLIELQEKMDAFMVEQQSEKMKLGNNNEGQTNDIRLPRVELPIFYGDFNKWLAFHDIYKRIVHENQALSETHKISFLKTHLGGEAARLISHLECSDANYKAAWDIITARYNNIRLLVTSKLSRLIGQQTLTTESASGLQNLHDTTVESMHALKNIGVDTSNWDQIVLYILTKKLDQESLRLYETSLQDPKTLQTLEDFLKFLEGRFSSLQSIHSQRTIKNFGHNNTAKPQTNKVKSFQTTTTTSCVRCNGNHSITTCFQFKNMPPAERSQLVNLFKLCRICLLKSHELSRCTSKTKCANCGGKHNTLLHLEPPKVNTVTLMGINGVQEPTRRATTSQQACTLLGTALVTVKRDNNKTDLLRMLIDPGSQGTFITNNAARKLKLQGKGAHAEIFGMGGAGAGISKKSVTLTIQPRFSSDFELQITALVLKTITKILPDKKFRINQLDHINNLTLADPTYNEPGPIDVLLGADHYSQILLNGIIKGQPTAQKTELGWIIFGAVPETSCNQICSMITSVEIDKTLTRFWELEEIQQERIMTTEEELCEQHFITTHRRNSDGRYTVSLPFKSESKQLGLSRNRAVARFMQLEQKFRTNKKFAEDYKKCMQEYIKLGHMRRVKEINNNENCYYMPHHAVIKETSSTTKLRVVFDASAKTTNNISLNDNLWIGPTLQQDLMSILTRWRKHKIVYTADIEKMYRQIWVTEEDQDFQRILWRSIPEEPMQEYKLTTVTFGTAAAPYLAIRTLQQLARDDLEKFPIAAKVVLKDFYVDDLISGNDCVEEAITTQREMVSLLKGGGFELRKWTSNHSDILNQIPKQYRENKPLQFDIDNTIKTLGIFWNPEKDTFQFKINLKTQTVATKRKLLSEASKLFDPLGWLAPTIIIAKLLLQELWIAGVTWDQPLPTKIEEKWIKYRNSLQAIEEINIPRWIQYENGIQGTLHGFCDASEGAYAAVVYFCTKNRSGVINNITILTSKTKVAPIKTKLTIPRLELCAALLLSKLLTKVQKSMELQLVNLTAWTDSMIVLSWIKGNPSKFKTFVANRVSQIQNLTQPSQWRYVKSNENPADYATRGVDPGHLKDLSLWWNGPSWLYKPETTWPSNSILNTVLETTQAPEQKRVAMMVIIKTTIFDQLFQKSVKTHTIIKTIAYCKRFINRLQKKTTHVTTILSTEEVLEARRIMIRAMQQTEYEMEIKRLSQNQPLSNKSKLHSLAPFVDEHGILRVGGRLQNSSWVFDKKHPILLPSGHPVTILIIKEAHQRTLHGGIQLTLSQVRDTYWISNGRSRIRHVIRQCLTCHRFNSQAKEQIMGNLPAIRITPSRPFSSTGVDYSGPLQIRTTKGRGHKSHKGYIAIFVCMVTKAIHIEVVSDLTSAAFIAAYKRFTSRRGLCQHIYSDNGTNFIGADAELKKTRAKAIQEASIEIAELLAETGTTWHFIPPAAAHFGGIWEAGVKSVKYHLKRVIGDTTLTYEELSTVLSQIEACLNSRPISAMSSDPNDLKALTPGHFLIGGPLLAVPEPNNSESNINNLTRWKMVQKMRDDFWKRWSKEYLMELQQRSKWQKEEVNIKIGEKTLIRDERLPPTKWIIGRIKEIHPGRDGKVRVATIECPGKIIFKRPISKLSPLPLKDENQHVTNIIPTRQNVNFCITINKPPNINKKRGQAIKPVKLKESCTTSKIRKLEKKVPQDRMRGKHISEVQSIAKKYQGDNFPSTENTPFVYTSTTLSEEEKYQISTSSSGQPYLVTKIGAAPSTSKEATENSSMTPSTSEKMSNSEIKSPKSSISHVAKLPTKDFLRGINTDQIKEIAKQFKPRIKAKNRTVRIHPGTPGSLLLFYIVCIFYIFSPIEAFNYKITKFQYQPGIYLEDVGHLSLIENKWDIILYYNLTNYWEELKGFKHNLDLLHQACQKPFNEIMCDHIYPQFQNALDQIEQNNQILSQLKKKETRKSRRRRGILNIGGNLAYEVFGVLDDRYAAKNEQQILKLQENEEHMLELLKNQTSISESTVNLILKSEKDIQLRIHKFEKSFEALKEVSTRAYTDFGHIRATQNFYAIALHSLMIMLQYQHTQRVLINCIIDVHHGRTSPALISPHQLQEQLTIIHKNIPQTLILPKSEDESYNQIYKLMTTKGRILNNMVVVVASLPLLSNEIFQLFKLIPVPIYHQNIFTSIEPSNDYLIINLKRNLFRFMNKMEFDKCQMLNTDNYVCSHNLHLYLRQPNRTICELHILNHEPFAQNCKMKQTFTQETIWIPLQHPNIWIYSTAKKHSIDIICHQKVETLILEGNGILHLNSPCSLRDGAQIISAQNTYRSKVAASILPPINITYQLQPVQKIPDIRTTNLEPIDITQELLQLQQTINTQKTEEGRRNQITTHDIHHYVVSYISLAVLGTVSAILVILWKKRNGVKRSNQNQRETTI